MRCFSFEDENHLYTGQFVECREVLLHPNVLACGELDCIHVDNTLANLQVPNLLHEACKKINKIVR